MDSINKQLHIFFFPLMAPGHIIPMSSLASLFASYGVRCTILTTPANDHLVRRHTTNDDHPIDLLLLPFPSTEFPNQSLSDASNSTMRFFHSLESLRDPFDRLLRDHHPDFVVSDSFLPWTADVARNAGVRRLVFQTMGFFPLCMYEMLERSNFSYSPNRETIVIDSLPGRVTMKVSQVQDSAMRRNDFSEFYERIMASEAESYGSIVNTFYEMEPEYADHYKTVMGRKAWHVGPVMNHLNEKDESGCVSWLDEQTPGSVVYVCFGSLSRFTSEQLREIAHGLKDSGRPYIWVIGNSTETLSEGPKGVIIRGWAPQGAILRHRAVGVFVTHCGWNSLMEGLNYGVPLVTWPLCFDQFYNERLVVDVLKVGVAVGAEVWTMKEGMRPLIGREAVKGAVERVMGGGMEAEEWRRRAREVGVMARGAVGKGGSSEVDMRCLVDELMGMCYEGL